jgi:hypothetical protein
LVGISAAGIASWCVFLYLRTGDPLAFFTVQSAPGWEQGAGPSTWLKFRFFEFAAERSSHAAFLACQAVAVAVFLAFLPRLARRLGVAYTAYTALIIAVPLVGSADFQGLGRYLLAAFPILLVAAEWLVDRPVLRNLTLVSGGGILALFTWLFARGFYLT